MDFYTRSRILKMIGDLTGNQWRYFMTGVIWSCFLVCVMSRAGLCWGSCRRWMSFPGKPKSNEVQLSSLEVTKVWASCSVARGFRNLTIFSIMWILWTHDLHSALTSSSILRWESNITPRFFCIRACRDCWITNYYCGDVNIFGRELSGHCPFHIKSLEIQRYVL